MDGKEIENILSKNPHTRNNFRGVYAVDELRKVKRPITGKINSFVVNLDPSRESGSHWVAIILKEGRKNIYFDSYGLPPIDKLLRSFLHPAFTHNTMQLQFPLSTTCGQWCILFILFQSLNISLASMQKLFSKHQLLKNDHKVNFYIHLLYKKRYKVIDRKFLKQQMCRSNNKVQ